MVTFSAADMLPSSTIAQLSKIMQTKSNFIQSKYSFGTEISIDIGPLT